MNRFFIIALCLMLFFVSIAMAQYYHRPGSLRGGPVVGGGSFSGSYGGRGGGYPNYGGGGSNGRYDPLYI